LHTQMILLAQRPHAWHQSPTVEHTVGALRHEAAWLADRST
jgi:hypothetical protein